MRSRCTEPDVGIIPGDWSVTQLRSTVLHHNSGIYKKSELYGNGSNIVGVSDLYGIDCVDGQRFAEVPLSRAELGKAHTGTQRSSLRRVFTCTGRNRAY